ncbi:unnamed protein product [Lymnaea stagnalis]|uniref:C2H2-type domain-containing protein n=1 Tax=Lymnaea stagnalis TaxID=6523 RepID=A0AAV2H293_LYMST
MAQSEFGPNDIVIHLVNPYKCGGCGAEFCSRLLFLEHLQDHIEKLKVETPCNQIICTINLVDQQPNDITVTRDILQINEHQMFELQDPSLDYTQLPPLKILEQAGILNLPPPRPVIRPPPPKFVHKEAPIILTVGEDSVKSEGKKISLLSNQCIQQLKKSQEDTAIHVQVVSDPNMKYDEAQICVQQVIDGENITDLDAIVQQAFFMDGKIKEELSITVEAPTQTDVETVFADGAPEDKTFDASRASRDKPPKPGGVSCPVCFNTFANASVLARHRVIHSGARPHPCIKCFKQFNDISTLRKHMLIHRRQHRCPICYRMYLQMSQLNVHLRQHSKRRFIQFGNIFHEVRVEVTRNAEGQQVQEYSLLILLTDDERAQVKNTMSLVKPENGFQEQGRSEVSQEDLAGTIPDTASPAPESEETAVKISEGNGEDLTKSDLESASLGDQKKKVIYKCGHCKKLIFTRPTLSRHLIKHTDTRPFHCDICPKSFRDKADLFHHTKTHTKPVQCNMCSSSFSKVLYLQNHLLKGCPISNNDERFTVLDNLKCQCNVCKRILKNKANVLRHLRVHAFQEKQKMEQSHNAVLAADSSFIADQLSQNIEDHFKGLDTSVGFQCLICGQEFRFKSFMITHVRMHLNQRPYKCDQCPKRFFAHHMLKKHLQNHTRPYKCPVCEKGFIRRYLMKDHFKKIHERESHVDLMKDITELYGQKLIQCDICGKTMKSYQKSLMQHHIRQHKDVRPFACKFCKKSFTSENALKKHGLNHSKPYVCQVCNRGFSRRYLLTEHFQNQCSRKKGLNVSKYVKQDKGSSISSNLPCDSRAEDVGHQKMAESVRYEPPVITEFNTSTSATVYTCQPCDKKFTIYDTLIRHINTFAKSTPCKYCGTVFEDKHLTVGHQRSCLGIPIDPAQKASNRDTSKKILGEQQEKVQKIVKEIAEKIELISAKSTSTELGKERQPTEGNQTVTEDSSVTLNDDPKSARPRATHAASQSTPLTRTLVILNEEKGKFQCPECERSFSSLRGMKIHASSHVRLYKCEICNKDFTQIARLRTHSQMHKDEGDDVELSAPLGYDLNENVTSSQQEDEDKEDSSEASTSKADRACTIKSQTPGRKRRKTHAEEDMDSDDDKMADAKVTLKELEVVNQRLMNSGTRGRPYSCKMCRRRFTEASGLEGHMAQIHGVKSEKN